MIKILQREFNQKPITISPDGKWISNREWVLSTTHFCVEESNEFPKSFCIYSFDPCLEEKPTIFLSHFLSYDDRGKLCDLYIVKNNKGKLNLIGINHKYRRLMGLFNTTVSKEHDVILYAGDDKIGKIRKSCIDNVNKKIIYLIDEYVDKDSDM